MQDMQGIEQYEQQIDYFEELKKIEQKIQVQGSKKDIKKNEAEDGLDDEYLMENIMTGGEEDEKERGYEREY